MFKSSAEFQAFKVAAENAGLEVAPSDFERATRAYRNLKAYTINVPSGNVQVAVRGDTRSMYDDVSDSIVRFPDPSALSSWKPTVSLFCDTDSRPMIQIKCANTEHARSIGAGLSYCLNEGIITSAGELNQLIIALTEQHLASEEQVLDGIDMS
jgi:hypothetical protein